jgi:hypothetical protein
MLQLMSIRSQFPDALSRDNIILTFQTLAREKIPQQMLLDIRDLLHDLMSEPNQQNVQA